LDFVKDNFSEEAGRDNTFNGRGLTQYQAVMNGSQLLYATSITGFDSLMQINAVFNGTPAYKGYPCESKLGNSFTPTMGIAMSSKCADKAGAWSFMRGILTPEYQSTSGRGFMGGGFPSNSTAFAERVSDAMTESTESMFAMITPGGSFTAADGGKDTDDDGESDVFPKGMLPSTGGSMLYYYAMTESELERGMQFINSITRLSESDDSVVQIIKEELGAFFNGQKTASAVADIIQSRVSLYVNEQL
ncbi:MAG: hypothetical protein LBC65_01080, partial [Oscillospiraceae bacterium]|nr:hypothetical protein [Oscillospiraceae bacterium]